ncbi:uroplakin-1b-like [Hyperolius riggenbachi]|uniref:uroplakin-1b-like n=1 Tax=Hyperolius riggenbachi TaxID=752182 RepID=UPI0035A32DB4
MADAGVRCFQGILIFGNVVIALSGIALTAECIFFVSDQYRIYPILEATWKADIFAAAWIGIFAGWCLFMLSILGIIGVMKSNRKMLLAYLILMFVVYCFEVASSITAITQRDFFTTNLYLKQMLQYYQNTNSANNNDVQVKAQGVTNTWNFLMLLRQCCGVNGPSDWQNYNSAFRSANSDSAFPWPLQCCVMDLNGQPLNQQACKLGLPGYLNTQGCFDWLAGPMNRHAWGVAWFGFSILCWAFWVLLGTMFYYTRIEG